MKSTNTSSPDKIQNPSGLTWKEHSQLFRKAIRSWRFFGIVFGVNILLIFTAGIVFQIIFLFSVVQGFMILATLNQSVYSIFLFVVNDKTLPRELPKPPLSAYLTSVIPFLTSAFFIFVGYIVFQKTGFCSQSLGCIIVALFQSIAKGQ